jgi:TfoX/Sxy family transcriptional regulator of competence genes
MKQSWKKSTPESIELFGRVQPKSPAVERRTMFGYPCVFVRGNMFGGLFGDDLFVRLPEPERTEFIGRKAGRPFEPTPGRVMKDYAVVSREFTADEEAVKDLFRRSLAHAKTLPEKVRLAGRGKS